MFTQKKLEQMDDVIFEENVSHDVKRFLEEREEGKRCIECDDELSTERYLEGIDMCQGCELTFNLE
jgi:ribosomal protein L37AE/L43A